MEPVGEESGRWEEGNYYPDRGRGKKPGHVRIVTGCGANVEHQRISLLSCLPAGLAVLARLPSLIALPFAALSHAYVGA